VWRKRSVDYGGKLQMAALQIVLRDGAERPLRASVFCGNRARDAFLNETRAHLREDMGR
jgi:hypothetical protein